MKKKIILLAQLSDSTRMVYNYLSAYYTIEKVIIEKPESKFTLIKRRIKKNGLARTVGQLLFQLLIQRYLRFSSKKRRYRIIKENSLSVAKIPSHKIQQIPSVNSLDCIEWVSRLNPDIVVVNGTRIIAKKLLNATKVKFINMHAGITPAYRGVHGAYWALVKKQPSLAGVTIHYIDQGIDTGNVIDQAIIKITPEDNFSTYPYLQLKEGLPLLKKAIDIILSGGTPIKKPLTNTSGLWYHPTIFQYFKNRRETGIK